MPNLSPNAFESGERKIIPAVLVYPFYRDCVLMIHRNSKQGDYHQGKWNGLGGKCEKDESPLHAAQRELAEETGLSLPLDRFRSLGVLQFPNFKAHKAEDWVVWIFAANVENEKDTAWTKGPEGELHWIERAKVLGLNLWEGDRLFLPQVLECKSVLGTIWYEGQTVSRHWISGL